MKVTTWDGKTVRVEPPVPDDPSFKLIECDACKRQIYFADYEAWSVVGDKAVCYKCREKLDKPKRTKPETVTTLIGSEASVDEPTRECPKCGSVMYLDDVERVWVCAECEP